MTTDVTPNRLTASEASARLADGSLSAESLVSARLRRVEERDSVVGAWEYLNPDAALRQARMRDGEPRRGPLHGIPVAIKDYIDTVDMPTGYGSPIYAGHRPAADAACVAMLREAGAVIVGKTVTTEFAAVTPGKTANPHNPEHTPGGSSSGSAAAVADFQALLALGTQTVGSTIRPAAYCGAVGFKPTYHTFSLAGVKAQAETMDTLGLMARTVDDVILLREDVLVEAVGLARADGEAPEQPVLDDRPADHRVAAHGADVADRRPDFPFDLVGRLFRRHQDRTGHGVAAVERTLRPLEHLDLLHIEELFIEAVRVGAENAIDDVGKGALRIAR